MLKRSKYLTYQQKQYMQRNRIKLTKDKKAQVCIGMELLIMNRAHFESKKYLLISRKYLLCNQVNTPKVYT